MKSVYILKESWLIKMIWVISAMCIVLFLLLIVTAIVVVRCIKNTEKDKDIIDNLKDELREAQTKAVVNCLEFDSKQAQLNTLEKDIENSESNKEQLLIRIDELNKILSTTAIEAQLKQAELSNLLETIREKTGEYTALNANYDIVLNLKDGAAKQLQFLEHDLESIKEQHRKALLALEGHADDGAPHLVFEPLSSNEQRLIELVSEIKVTYPELSLEFGKIIWNKVWMPKIQSWVKMYELDKYKNAIYKLTLLSNSTVCYVGQAVDVKERWYTHIKKMVGAEVKGGEKLYNGNFNPNDFEWSIIEDELDKSVMNQRERYWIDFFGAKLNVK